MVAPVPSTQVGLGLRVEPAVSLTPACQFKLAAFRVKFYLIPSHWQRGTGPGSSEAVTCLSRARIIESRSESPAGCGRCQRLDSVKAASLRPGPGPASVYPAPVAMTGPVSAKCQVHKMHFKFWVQVFSGFKFCIKSA